MPDRTPPTVGRTVTVTVTRDEADALHDHAAQACHDCPGVPPTATGRDKLADALTIEENQYLLPVRQIAHIQQVVHAHARDLPIGDVDDTTDAWFYAGFLAPEVQEWMNAGCFDPAAARELLDACLTPDAAAHIPAGDHAPGDTIGYLVSMRELTAVEAVESGDLGAADPEYASHVAAIDALLTGRDLPAFAATAEGWFDGEFSAPAVRLWLDARCFTPRAARALLDAGLDATYAARLALRPDGVEDTLGFKIAAGTLAVADAIAVSNPEDAPARGTGSPPTRPVGP